MGGIAGVVYTDEKRADPKLLAQMTDVLEHRGPDARGLRTFAGGGMGHRHCAVFEGSEVIEQPLRSSKGRYTLAYSGTVYNFGKLRAELEGHGHQFVSDTDAEVVLNALIAWKADALSRFEGAFSLALWDSLEQKLLLARDSLGIAPLYYYRSPTALYFGSELKALLKAPMVPRSFDPQGLHELLWHHAPLGESTLFRDLKRVEAGAYGLFQDGHLMFHRFAKIEAIPQRHQNQRNAARRVRELLETAVRAQLTGTAPGVILESDWASSALAAFASWRLGNRLRTYTVYFDHEPQSKLMQTRYLAHCLGSEHRELRVTVKDVSDLLPYLVCAHDQPTVAPSDVVTYLTGRHLREEVKVLLRCDGSNEIFGQGRYKLASLSPHLRNALWAFKPILRLPISHPWWVKTRQAVDTLHIADSAQRTALLVSAPPHNAPTCILAPEVRDQVEPTNPFERYRQVYGRLGHRDPVNRMLQTNCLVHLPDMVLEHADRPLAAWGIEVRMPFLDNQLTDHVLGLPAKYKARLRQKKWLLRRALEGVIPDSILNAQNRRTEVPSQEWLRGPLEPLLRETLERSKLLDHATVKNLLQQHYDRESDWGSLLWKALSIAIWEKIYF